MNEQFSFRWFVFALLIGLGGALAGAFFPVFLIPAIAAIVFLGLTRGVSYAAVAFVFTAAGAYFGSQGDLPSLVSTGCVLVFSTGILYFGFKKRLAYRYIALILAVVVFLALYIGIGYRSLAAGKAPYTELSDTLAELSARYTQAGVEFEDLDVLRENLSETFYGMLIMLSEAAAFLLVILTKIFSRAKRGELRPMAKFRSWQLPRSLKLGLPVIVLAIIVTFILELPLANTLAYTAAYMLLPLFIVTGIAFIYFFALRIGRLPRFVGVLLIVFAFMSPFLAAMLGIVDLYSGTRRKLERVDRLVQEAFETAEREKRDRVIVDFGDGRGPQVIAVRKENSEAFFDDDILNGEDDENAENPENTEDAEKNGDNGAETETEGPEESETNDNNENTNGGDEQ